VPREDRPVDPRDGGGGDQPRLRGDLGADQVEDIIGAGVTHLRDLESCTGREQRTGQPEMLGVGRDDVVARPESQPDDDYVHPLRGGFRQRDAPRGHVDLSGEQRADALAGRQHLLEVRPPAAAVLRLPGAQAGDRLHRRAGERAERAGVQIGVVLEHGKARAHLGPADTHL